MSLIARVYQPVVSGPYAAVRASTSGVFPSQLLGIIPHMEPYIMWISLLITVALASGITGYIAGFRKGRKDGLVIGKLYGRMSVFTTGLEVKNPEMWELLHHYVVDKGETTKLTRQRVERAALEKRKQQG